MKQDTNRHKTSLALIISIIAHILLFLIIIIVTIPELAPEASQKNPENELLVELQDDYTQPTPPEQLDWVAMDTTPPSQKLVEAAESPDDHMPELYDPAQNNVEATKELTEKQQEPDEIDQSSLDDIVALATRILDEPKPEDKIVEQPKKVEKREDIVVKPPSLAYAPPIPAKKLPTLAQVTQGFMEHMNQQSTMTVESKNRGQASADQMKRMSYDQKIIGCLVTSYSIHRNKAPKTPPCHRLLVHMSLAQNGQINALNIIQSSGNPSVDQFIIAMFKDASTSFPPVPASFVQKPYPLPTFQIDSVESFQSAHNWRYVNE